ncbi:hypothetical protein HDU99_000072 [Rhizoclosmatium hyalinum]|nr:hypothetical protein HDU99_000072 [Rhizoclosmatium hyalinum]
MPLPYTNEAQVESLWKNSKNHINDGVSEKELVSWHKAGKQQSWLFDKDDLWKAVSHGSLAQIREFAMKTPEVDKMRGLFERGGEGETILHAAILCGRSPTIIIWILAHFPKLLNKTYLGERYKGIIVLLKVGETALHLAVVQEEDQDPSDDVLSIADKSILNDLLSAMKENREPTVVTRAIVDAPDYRYSGKSIVRMLIEAGASLDSNLRAIGTEFRAADKGTLRFYGQTVLHFAAVSGKPKIVEYLVDCGAEVKAVDGHTNDNILHLLMKNEGIDKTCFARMFQFLKSKSPELLEKRNNDKKKGQRTPYQLGMHLDNKNVLEAMKEKLWEFDRTRRYRVPLNHLDPIYATAPPFNPETPNKPTKGAVTENSSLLEIVIERHNEEMLDHPILRTILQWKWNAYAKHIYFRKLMMFFVLIAFMLTPAIALQPNSPTARRDYDFPNGFDVARVVFEVGTLVGTVGLFCYYFSDIHRKWNAADNYLRWFFSAIVVTVPVIRFAGSNEFMFNFENVVFGFAMISGYLYLLTFSKGSATIGHLVVIVKEIVSKDFPEWLFVYIPITVGFGGALFMQMQNVGNVVSGDAAPSADRPYDWDSLHGSSLWAIRFIFQEEKYEDIKKGALPVYSQLLFLTYAVFAVVLLVNVLIAKLVNTFDRINEKSEKVWRMELAALIMSIDMGLSDKEKDEIKKHFGFELEDSVAETSSQNETSHQSGNVTEGQISVNTSEKLLKLKYLQFTERERRDAKGQVIPEVYQVVAHQPQKRDTTNRSAVVNVNTEEGVLQESNSEDVADDKPRGAPDENTNNDEFILEPADLKHWRGWRVEMATVFSKPTYNLISTSGKDEDN